MKHNNFLEWKLQNLLHLCVIKIFKYSGTLLSEYKKGTNQCTNWIAYTFYIHNCYKFCLVQILFIWLWVVRTEKWNNTENLESWIIYTGKTFLNSAVGIIYLNISPLGHYPYKKKLHWGEHKRVHIILNGSCLGYT